MTIVKKSFAVSEEALVKLYILLPNIVFAFLIDVKKDDGTLHTALPFILLYCFQKMGIFTLDSFGKITNYLKVLRVALSLALLGSCLALIGVSGHKEILIDLGAIFLGSGLSCLPLLDKEAFGSRLPKIKRWALVLTLVIIGLVSLAIKYQAKFFELLLLVGLLGGAWINAFLAPTSKEKMLDHLAIKWRSFVPAGTIFILYAMIRTYRQTALISDFEWMLIFCGIILLSFIYKNMFNIFEQTYQFWLGALKNFLVIYTLFWLFVLGKMQEIMLAFVILIVSGLLASQIIQKLTPKKLFGAEVWAYLGTLIGLLGMILPKTYLVGLFCACLCSSVADKLNTQVGENVDQTGKVKTLGSVVQQIFLGATIEFVSLVMLHSPQALIYPTVYHQTKASYYLPAITVRVILITVFIISGSLIFFRKYKQQVIHQKEAGHV